MSSAASDVYKRQFQPSFHLFHPLKKVYRRFPQAARCLCHTVRTAEGSRVSEIQAPGQEGSRSREKNSKSLQGEGIPQSSPGSKGKSGSCLLGAISGTWPAAFHSVVGSSESRCCVHWRETREWVGLWGTRSSSQGMESQDPNPTLTPGL